MLHIFETMYHAALEASSELAEIDGSYETFEGSPASQGILQPDMWEGETKFSGSYDWDAMREAYKDQGSEEQSPHGPHAHSLHGTDFGNNECFEPYTTNIYLRRTLAGEFVCVNKHLVESSQECGLWSKEMKDIMVKAGGSIQNIVDIPMKLRNFTRLCGKLAKSVSSIWQPTEVVSSTNHNP